MATNLEKKAEKSILESIDKLVTSSLLMLLFESLLLKSSPSLKDASKEKRIKGVYEYLIEIITNLENIVDNGGDEKEFHLKKCLQLKDEILDVYGNVKLYMSACNIIDLCIEEHIQLMENEDTDYSIPFSELKKLFKQKTEQLLDDAVKNDVEEAAAAILFTVFPNYLTDSELADYIEYSGSFYFENCSLSESMSHINQIKRSFAPQKMPDFGKCYPKDGAKLFEIVEKIRLSGMGDGFSETVKKYEKLCQKIEGIADALSGMYSSLTYISIILSSMFSFDDILKGDVVYRDYFKKTVELLGSKANDVFIETLISSLDNTIEKEVEELDKIAKRKELIYKNVNFENFSENTKTLFSMEFFLTTAFFENIEDAESFGSEFLSADEEAPADIKTARKEMKALELFIKESCFGMNEELKRNARRNIFLSVPLASYYDKEKVMKYVDKLCASMKSAVEMESVLSSIEKIIDEKMLVKLSILEF